MQGSVLHASIFSKRWFTSSLYCEAVPFANGAIMGCPFSKIPPVKRMQTKAYIHFGCFARKEVNEVTGLKECCEMSQQTHTISQIKSMP